MSQKLRIYCGDHPLSESDIPIFTHSPRVATNAESPGWKDFIKNKRSFTIPSNAFVPEPPELPEPIEREVRYYYRRGNKMFFILTESGQRFIFTVDEVPSGLKYGTYPAKFGFK